MGVTRDPPVGIAATMAVGVAVGVLVAVAVTVGVGRQSQGPKIDN